MWFKSNRDNRMILLVIGFVAFFFTIAHLRSLRTRSGEYGTSESRWRYSKGSSAQSSWVFDANRDAFNYGLSDEQCDAAFPGLFAEIYRARDHLLKHNKTIGRKDVHLYHDEERARRPHYELHVLLHDGELYVLHQNDGVWPHHYRAVAGLANFYRAMVALPDLRRLPNVEFVLNADDYYARPDEPGFADGRPRFSWNRHKDDPWTWVMPDFGGWMFSDDGVQSYAQFRADVGLVEREYLAKGKRGGWDDKTPKLAWRGSMGLGESLRHALVDAAKDKPWSDVSAMEIIADKDIRNNVLDMADFCRYKYLAHTEGLSWSGRLRYLMNCESVPLIHEREWVAHFYPLLQSSGPHQNHVAVKRDWSDLGDRMRELEKSPARARRIAREVGAQFRDRYLTPAAEACYLRRMLAVYATVQGFEPRSHYVVDPAAAAADEDSGEKKRKRRGVSFAYYLTPAPYSKFGFLAGDKERYEAEG
ncbi:glycosyl transferase family 90-domain-containing protein [Apiospora aurea]|uniref:Glycosyl transferase family 90-domain-containing protein n=1 Tax=Apiospora aurea TaxID=335848 RepID=A0ABR1QGD0_9PEZI